MNYEIIIPVAVLIFIIFDAWLEAKHDHTHIQYSKGFYLLHEGNNYKKRWHRLSFIDRFFEYLWVCVLFGIIIQSWLLPMVLLAICGFWYWLLFDWFIGYRLDDGNMFYIGRKARKIFINGIFYSIFKIIWLVILTGLYRELLKLN